MGVGGGRARGRAEYSTAEAFLYTTLDTLRMADAAAPVTWTTPQKYVAEFLGTFILLAVGIGSAIFMGASGINIGFVALAVGFSIGVSVFAWGNISGGCFNPAVTLSMFVSGRLKFNDMIGYWIMQVLGAITGMAVIFAIAKGDMAPGANLPATTAMGSNGYYVSGVANGYIFSAGAVILLEIVATFLFTLVIQFVTDKQAWKGFGPLAVGFTLTILVLMGVGVDGLSVNPARSTGSAVLAAVAGVNWPANELWAFWVGPFVGAILAGILWRLFYGDKASTAA